MSTPVPVESPAIVIGRTPPQGLVLLTHVMYGLHVFSAVNGLLSQAFVITVFLTGWPSLLAVILNYIKRGATRGTYLDSHFGWQLRTFWWALGWVVLAFLVLGLLSLPVVTALITIPTFMLIAILIGIWVLYRLIRGWLALVEDEPMPEPARQG